jgi:uncharacterized protein YggE
MKKLPLFLFVCCATRFASAEVTLQGSPEETKAYLSKTQTQVTLKGRASSVVEAGEIKAHVAVLSDAPTPGTVLALHEDQKKMLLAKLQAIGIQRGQVTVPKFATLTPRYGTSGDQAIGHRAESTLTIELSDQKQYVDLLGVLDKAREARLDHLSYDHAQLTNLQKQILTNALKKVMTRKEIYEQSLGVTLRPVSFNEEDMGEKLNFSQGSRYGQIAIEAAVQVVFEIDPHKAPAVEKQASPAP